MFLSEMTEREMWSTSYKYPTKSRRGFYFETTIRLISMECQMVSNYIIESKNLKDSF
jgi:hypothetical protein